MSTRSLRSRLSSFIKNSETYFPLNTQTVSLHTKQSEPDKHTHSPTMPPKKKRGNKKKGAMARIGARLDGAAAESAKVAPPEAAPELPPIDETPVAVAMRLPGGRFRGLAVPRSGAMRTGEKVAFLLDCSGSMSGGPGSLTDKMHQAYKAVLKSLLMAKEEGGNGLRLEDIEVYSFACAHNPMRHHNVGTLSLYDLNTRGATYPCAAAKLIGLDSGVTTIILISDGKLNDSPHNCWHTKQLLKGKKVMVIGIGGLWEDSRSGDGASHTQSCRPWTDLSEHPQSTILAMGRCMENVSGVMADFLGTQMCTLVQAGRSDAPLAEMDSEWLPPGVIPHALEYTLLMMDEMDYQQAQATAAECLDQCPEVVTPDGRFRVVEWERIMRASEDPRDRARNVTCTTSGQVCAGSPIVRWRDERFEEVTEFLRVGGRIASEWAQDLAEELQDRRKDLDEGKAMKELSAMQMHMENAKWAIYVNRARKRLEKRIQKLLHNLSQERNIRNLIARAVRIAQLAGERMPMPFGMSFGPLMDAISFTGEDDEDNLCKEVMQMSPEDIASLTDEQIRALKKKIAPMILVVRGMCRNMQYGETGKPTEPVGADNPMDALRCVQCEGGRGQGLEFMIIEYATLESLAQRLGLDVDSMNVEEMCVAVVAGGELRMLADMPQSTVRIFEGLRMMYGAHRNAGETLVFPVCTPNTDYRQIILQCQMELPKRMLAASLIGEATQASHATWVALMGVAYMLLTGATEQSRQHARIMAATVASYGESIYRSMVLVASRAMRNDGTPMPAALMHPIRHMLTECAEGEEEAFQVEGDEGTFYTMEFSRLQAEAPNVLAVIHNILKTAGPEAYRLVLSLFGSETSSVAADHALAALSCLVLVMEEGGEDTKAVRDAVALACVMIRQFVHVPKALERCVLEAPIEEREQCPIDCVEADELRAPDPNSLVAYLMSLEELHDIRDEIMQTPTVLPCLAEDTIVPLIYNRESRVEAVMMQARGCAYREAMEGRAENVDRALTRAGVAVQFCCAVGRSEAGQAVDLTATIPDPDPHEEALFMMRHVLRDRYGVPELCAKVMASLWERQALAAYTSRTFSACASPLEVLAALVNGAGIFDVKMACKLVWHMLQFAESRDLFADAVRMAAVACLGDKVKEVSLEGDREVVSQQVHDVVGTDSMDALGELMAAVQRMVNQNTPFVTQHFTDRLGFPRPKPAAGKRVNEMMQSLVCRGGGNRSLRFECIREAFNESESQEPLYQGADPIPEKDCRLAAAVTYQTLKKEMCQPLIPREGNCLQWVGDTARFCDLAKFLCGAKRGQPGDKTVVYYLAQAAFGNAVAFEVLTTNTSLSFNKTGGVFKDLVDLSKSAVFEVLCRAARGDSFVSPQVDGDGCLTNSEAMAAGYSEDALSLARARLRIALLDPALVLAANYGGSKPYGKGAYASRVMMTLFNIVGGIDGYEVADRPKEQGARSIEKERFRDRDADIMGMATPAYMQQYQTDRLTDAEDKLAMRKRVLALFNADSIPPLPLAAMLPEAVAFREMLCHAL